ncbi:thioredoxin domain-containing protein [Sphingomonas sp. ST-64]|uniref:Thioredoxin domain-containing protein n=1 Tax=Sphingomonas plantiphila TaxID=3163295 RepID=A0ABW8YIB4_9SPHN
MRVLRLFLALFVATLCAGGATAQAPARDWRTYVVQAPSGAFLIGNPAAKVKLIEYLSYTCPHCAHFVEESKASLHDDLVKRGQVRVEFRHAIRDPLDMTAALLARCSGPRAFAGTSEALFATQSTWYQQGAQWWQANIGTIEGQPPLARFKALANGSGLAQMMRKRGMTTARINQCFATPTDLDKLTAMTDAAWKTISGTPSFMINGKAGGGGHWQTLEPELRAAGAR